VTLVALAAVLDNLGSPDEVGPTVSLVIGAVTLLAGTILEGWPIGSPLTHGKPDRMHSSTEGA
jgi:hypothetical protein